MAEQKPMAGGFLLILAILIGFGWGVAEGDPVKGAVLGTAVGIVIAVIVWLWDRRRRRI